MFRRHLARYLPDPAHLRSHWALRRSPHFLQDPRLWHLGRRQVAGGVAIGLFVACLPLPGQMALAALLGIRFRVNLPVAVVMVWASNPFTFAPIGYTAYWLGRQLLGAPPLNWDNPLSLEWIQEELAPVWRPLLLGLLILGSASALIGYYGVLAVWRTGILLRRRAQRLRRRRAALDRNRKRSSTSDLG